MDWNLVNPWAKGSDEEKKKKKDAEPVSPAAYRCMTWVVAITIVFAVVGGLSIIIFFHDQSVKVLFGVFAVLIFLSTVVFGVALYVSLGFLQKSMLAAKRKEAEKVEPPEEWDMPKREKNGY